MTISQYVRMAGGVDEMRRGLDVPPGMLHRGVNVECKPLGGYRRILGYAKFDTSEVPGEGKILGVWYYDGKVYAFRNAVGGATAVMHSSTGSGWTAEKTGLAPDGNYEFDNANFAGTLKMYGASGTHKAFEWDGTTWTDITTGMTTDAPSHIKAHRKHLFLSFGPSVQHSPLGDPTGTWTAVTGASEMLMESDVTGFMQLTGGYLGLFSRNSTAILSGSGSASWGVDSLVEHGNKIGCIEGSLQQMGARVYYLDDRGVVDFFTTQKFGDFDDATISQNIQNTISTKKNTVASSCVIKSKSQYRLFFEDGTGAVAVFNGRKLVGWTHLSLPLVVRCVVSTEDTNGDERIYFGSDDGYIYEMEQGTSFDGAAINEYLVPALDPLKTPRQAKRFKRAVLDMQSSGLISLKGKAEFKFRQGVANDYQAFTSAGGGGFILGYSTLGSGLLGSGYLVESTLDIPGTGEYVTVHLSNTDVSAQWELDGITYEFNYGRRRRG